MCYLSLSLSSCEAKTGLPSELRNLLYCKKNANAGHNIHRMASGWTPTSIKMARILPTTQGAGPSRGGRQGRREGRGTGRLAAAPNADPQGGPGTNRAPKAPERERGTIGDGAWCRIVWLVRANTEQSMITVDALANTCQDTGPYKNREMRQAGTQVGPGRLGWQAAQAETTKTKACIEGKS